MSKFKIYNFQFGKIMDVVVPDLFGGKTVMTADEAFAKKQELLRKLFEDDYNKTARISFSNRGRNRQYTHKHLMPPTDDMIVMRVVNKTIHSYTNADFEKEKREEYPNCIVIIDNRPGIQRIAIEDKKGVFSKDTTLPNIIQSTLSNCLRKYNLSLELLKLQDSRTFWNYINDTKTYPKGFSKIIFHLPYLNLERLHDNIDRLMLVTKDLRESMDSDFYWEQRAQKGGKLKIAETDEQQKAQIDYLMGKVGGDSIGLVPNGNQGMVIWMKDKSSFYVTISNHIFDQLKEDAAGNTLFGSSALDAIKAKTKEGI